MRREVSARPATWPAVRGRWAGRNAADMHAIAERLAAELPRSTPATIAGTAHVPSLERPAEFDRLVLEFLRAAPD